MLSNEEYAEMVGAIEAAERLPAIVRRAIRDLRATGWDYRFMSEQVGLDAGLLCRLASGERDATVSVAKQLLVALSKNRKPGVIQDGDEPDY